MNTSIPIVSNLWGIVI